MPPGFILPISIAVILLIFVSAYSSARRATKPNGLPERGDLHCPFCRAFIAKDVSWVGQQVNCPKCSGAFNAPNHLGPKDATGEALGKVIGGLILVALAFWLASF